MRKPLRKRGVLAEALPDEAILYNADLGALHVLNATAAAIWELCDGDHGVDAIAQHLRSQYAAPPGYLIEQDVGRTLDELWRLGLLEPG